MIPEILNEPLQFISSSLILIGLWNTVKNKNWWLVYFIGSFIFTLVNFDSRNIGFTLFGCTTLVMAVKNYFYKGKK